MVTLRKYIFFKKAINLNTYKLELKYPILLSNKNDTKG